MPDAPYIQKLAVMNYGCIRDAEFPLTRLHAFIGPNDSGKSTILHAVREAMPYRVPPGDTPLHNGSQDWHIRATYNSGAWCDSTRGVDEHAPADETSRVSHDSDGWGPDGPPATMLLRLDPDQLRKPCHLIPDDAPLQFLDDRGTGLPAVYDAIFSRHPRHFFGLSDELTRLFPTVKALGWANVDAGTKQMQIRLMSGEFVRADRMSEGMLYYLAFAALPYLDPVSAVLIEEPENGLHPTRIVEVMEMLRKLSTRTQVLIATHSPLVVNQLEPHEVTVVTRHAQSGTKGILMRDTVNFQQRSKVYGLGEMWLSYANGTDESPLIHGGPRP